MASKTISATDKQALLQKRLKLLLELGEQAHLLCRTGQTGQAALQALQTISAQISHTDAAIAAANGEGHFSRELAACPSCGTPLGTGTIFCSECGFSIHAFLEGLAVQCRVCGAYAAKQQQFCNICGNRL